MRRARERSGVLYTVTGSIEPISRQSSSEFGKGLQQPDAAGSHLGYADVGAVYWIGINPERAALQTNFPTVSFLAFT